MVTTQIIGATTTNTAEVEANTLAMRGTLRADDVGTLGHYSIANVSGVIPAAFTTAGNIFAFRWGDATRVCTIHRIIFSAGNDGTGFAAGLVQINAFMARGFNASYTGGTSLTPTGNMNKLRTSFGTSLVTDIRIATTASLGAPSPAAGVDNDPFASLICGVPTTNGAVMLPPTPMFDQRPGEHPIVLMQNEGFIIQTGGIAIAITGTWKFSVKVEWSEVTSYP